MLFLILTIDMRRSILMLEHDDDDRYITGAVFRENNYAVDIHFVESCNDLFAFLIACERTHMPLPRVMLLSYDVMRDEAVATISALRQDRRYSHIPIVIVGGVADPGIVRACYAAGASSFIRKPASGAEVTSRIGSFFHYWFETVELPENHLH